MAQVLWGQLYWTHSEIPIKLRSRKLLKSSGSFLLCFTDFIIWKIRTQAPRVIVACCDDTTIPLNGSYSSFRCNLDLDIHLGTELVSTLYFSHTHKHIHTNKQLTCQPGSQKPQIHAKPDNSSLVRTSKKWEHGLLHAAIQWKELEITWVPFKFPLHFRSLAKFTKITDAFSSFRWLNTSGWFWTFTYTPLLLGWCHSVSSVAV